DTRLETTARTGVARAARSSSSARESAVGTAAVLQAQAGARDVADAAREGAKVLLAPGGDLAASRSLPFRDLAVPTGVIRKLDDSSGIRIDREGCGVVPGSNDDDFDLGHLAGLDLDAQSDGEVRSPLWNHRLRSDAASRRIEGALRMHDVARVLPEVRR